MLKYGIIFGLILLSFLATAWFLYQKGQEKPVVYETGILFETDIIKKTVATGSIVPQKEVSLKSQVPGIVEKVYVTAGEQVKNGQKIAKIKLIPSPANINNAETSIDQLKMRVKDAEKELQRQKNINSQQIDIGAAKIALEQAETEEKRQKQLFQEGIISEQAYQQFVVDVNTRRNQLDQSKAGSDRDVSRYQLDLDIRKAELEAAKDNLRILREGASNRSKEVSNVITSTMSGMILDVPLEEGGFVIESNAFNEGSTIASVADMGELLFEGKVAEAEVGKLKEGMPLVITIGAIEERSFDGTLNFIAPKGKDEEGSIQFEVEASIKVPEDIFIRAGYSANADIILAKKEKVWAINERDLLFSNDSTFVELETGEQEFHKKHIEVGLSDGINIEVLKGIEKTDKVKVQN